MAFRFKDKNDIKTFILYLLMNVDRPVDIATLNDLTVQDDFVNQFDFMDAFFELCSSGAVISEKKDGEQLYFISPKGRTAAEMLEGDISAMIRERSAISAMRLLSFERRGARSASKISEENDKFLLSCSVYDKDGKSMSLELSIDTKRKAEAMKRNFDEKPEFVYRAMLGVLSGDINYLAESWIGDEESDDEE